MAESGELILPEPAATLAAGAELGRAIPVRAIPLLTIYLRGDLGAGKTTLVRGLLEALGHRGPVPSPTYALIEPYSIRGIRIAHVDLYRIRSTGEIDEIDILAEHDSRTVLLIEWPEQGEGHLPLPDLEIDLEVLGKGRRLRWLAHGESGEFVARGLCAPHPVARPE